jgi:hypothetical protein
VSWPWRKYAQLYITTRFVCLQSREYGQKRFEYAAEESINDCFLRVILNAKKDGITNLTVWLGGTLYSIGVHQKLKEKLSDLETLKVIQYENKLQASGLTEITLSPSVQTGCNVWCAISEGLLPSLIQHAKKTGIKIDSVAPVTSGLLTPILNSASRLLIFEESCLTLITCNPNKIVENILRLDDQNTESVLERLAIQSMIGNTVDHWLSFNFSVDKSLLEKFKWTFKADYYSDEVMWLAPLQ